jgi:hypothetical protein
MFWPFEIWWRDYKNQRDPESLGFDAEWGTETASFGGYNYEPSRPSLVEALLDRITAEVRPDVHTFVDLGSGKGRVVFQAACRPFAAVVGIEHELELHLRAVRNYDSFSTKARADGVPLAPVRLLLGDAREHSLPTGPLVAYMYNPFSAVVLAGVAERIARPGAVLVYVNPFEAEVLTDWREVDRGGDGQWAWRMYRFR